MAIVELWLSKLLDFRAGEKNCQNSTPSLSPGDHDYGRLAFHFAILQKLLAENRLDKLACTDHIILREYVFTTKK